MNTSGIAEAVVPQRQPASDVLVGDMIKKDPPQRDAAAGIYLAGRGPGLSAPKLADH